jgi:hypothetical protein
MLTVAGCPMLESIGSADDEVGRFWPGVRVRSDRIARRLSKQGGNTFSAYLVFNRRTKKFSFAFEEKPEVKVVTLKMTKPGATRKQYFTRS